MMITHLLSNLFIVSNVNADACRDGLIDPVALYGTNEVAFDVYRKNKKIGEQTMRFGWTDEGLKVDADMTLKVKVLFITAYKLQYKSSATWCGGQLASLNVQTNDNGDYTEIFAERLGESIVIRNGDAEYMAPTDIMTTNHWNPDVVNQSMVLNTLTGNLNQVQIIPDGQSVVESADGISVPAYKFTYTGELESTVWYDADGRWLKLAFRGSDGSIIEYVPRFLNALREEATNDRRESP